MNLNRDLKVWALGDQASSEQLIQDLYVDLRNKSLLWSDITQQTPQARMGYIGQHLTSIVTGIPGGKSGARGYDLIFPDGAEGEIKTCYRVDQLGACSTCGKVVSSIETSCSFCGGTAVVRKDDSKWLIGVKTEADFAKLLRPRLYYLVLFEFVDISDASNDDIVASIWSVDPSNLGFAACMVDYKLNIQSKSKSKAAFNLWPWSPKFYLMKPRLIYRSIIGASGVTTKHFHGKPNDPGALEEPFPPITERRRAKTFTIDNLSEFVLKMGGKASANREQLFTEAELIQQAVDNETFCDELAYSIYRPLLRGKSAEVPSVVLKRAPVLNSLLAP